MHAALQASLRARSRPSTWRFVEAAAGAARHDGRRPGWGDPSTFAARILSRICNDPRPAVTRFGTERTLPDDTLLRVTLETGRTHQIRAHLLAIGHPVVGDPDDGHAGRHGLCRQFLHAAPLCV